MLPIRRGFREVGEGYRMLSSTSGKNTYTFGDVVEAADARLTSAIRIAEVGDGGVKPPHPIARLVKTPAQY